MLKSSDFYYDLPEELIAQTPAEPRDSSRLLVYERATGKVEHRVFHDVTDYLGENDLLVINTTKVYPARVYAKAATGGKMEILLLKRLDLTDWEVLVKPGKRAKEGAEFFVSDELSFTVLSKTDGGGRVIRFKFDGVFEDKLSKVGEMPLPPYIKKKLEDQSRYQTVYCKEEGSAAAPTAGLHFTEELIRKLKDKGVGFAEVNLHVGLGTFRPVKVENVEEHEMHSEYFEISKTAADTINEAKAAGKNIVAVGTTSVRTLESVADENGFVKPCQGDTKIFIYPPYKFKCVDKLITNFHLPESTLIMLVSAFIGREETLALYKTAVDNKYRFFSFGDACLLL
ncbi:MAG: tRNA preQ1(34) S-adenosylmethionine ribosyltransferase-isomerase QueA [Clostridia bacterium]|nr:tRNA preQ1(34) S-adenosylmethionine ribosyltransferase-isomerase QueA [Clostridia bacterium]